MTRFLEAMEGVGQAVDIAGVIVMVLGLLLATVAFLARRWRGGDALASYHAYRQGVGRAILLGLEILVAADIIRTIAVEPSFRGLGVLAVIVLIRTFLSATLELEIEGRWPWQRREAQRAVESAYAPALSSEPSRRTA